MHGHVRIREFHWVTDLVSPIIMSVVFLFAAAGLAFDLMAMSAAAIVIVGRGTIERAERIDAHGEVRPVLTDGRMARGLDVTGYCLTAAFLSLTLLRTTHSVALALPVGIGVTAGGGAIFLAVRQIRRRRAL